jgi:hypothetical protein
MQHSARLQVKTIQRNDWSQGPGADYFMLATGKTDQCSSPSTPSPSAMCPALFSALFAIALIAIFTQLELIPVRRLSR